MPELPEVETVCRGIEQNIISKKVESIYTSNKNLRLPFPRDILDLEGKEIESVARRARYILIKISDQKILLVHLGMSGKLLFYQTLPENFAKHDHFVMGFDDGSGLVYNDPRRFGLVDLVDEDKINQHQMIKNLGVEPLTDEFDAKHLQKKLQGKKTNIKTAMMDNAVVVGVGNIYINESLFESKISPLRESGSLDVKDLEILIFNIKSILQNAIDKGGSTLRDYVQLNGNVGAFQFDFKVYGREGDDCVVCNNSEEKIIRIKQNGRSTFYCQSCQK
ncbi:MAG: formamidopyrimidine-DNA glycosylase [Myxococcota bacterium]|jgi:formamidopyrimidine-DNA glycosylase